MTLHFGAAAADITPPVGIAMGGYWGRRSGAMHIRDRLMAKALVCGQGAARVALVAVDLVGLDADAVRAIRERVKCATGIEDAAVMVCASHTHSGPLTFPFRGMGCIDGGYLEQVADAVVEVVVAAAAGSRAGPLVLCAPSSADRHKSPRAALAGYADWAKSRRSGRALRTRAALCRCRWHGGHAL